MREAEREMASGRCRLVFVAPERLLTGRFLELAERAGALRREIAAERGVPAYVILHDSTLRDLSRLRPESLDGLRAVRGIGEKKLADLGARLLKHVAEHARKADAP